MLEDFTAPREKTETPEANFTVSQFLTEVNDMLLADFDDVTIIGEVASFKINQGKWVFFDLKDDETSLGCFMPVFKLRTALEDGMKVIVKGHPGLTKWGKFSFTVENVMPVGAGSIKRSFELLKAKLEKEGLFDPAKKRPLPDHIETIGVISSTQAAGYADFIKIVNERWGGLKIKVAHTGVQGLSAAPQIIRALEYMNEHNTADVIAIIRGGGSADDLAVFNDEALVRAIAASKIPVITGIGHEVDTSLADLAADVVASTPSNAAQMLTHDRKAYIKAVNDRVSDVYSKIMDRIETTRELSIGRMSDIYRFVTDKIDLNLKNVQNSLRVLESLNPERVLKKGYAIIRGDIEVGSELDLETIEYNIKAEVKSKERK